jgi:hypothetical protein
MSDDPKNKGGRPRSDDPRVIMVATYLSSKEYQRLYDEAKRDEKSLAAKLRERFEARQRDR